MMCYQHFSRKGTRVLTVGLFLFFFHATYAQVPLSKQDPERASAATILTKANGDTRVGNRQHELVPSIVSSADGKALFVAWYTGGPGEGPGNYVTLSVSTDDGKSWKNDELVVYPKKMPWRFYDPAFWRDPSGQVWLFYGVSNSKLINIWDLKAGVNALPIGWNGQQVVHGKPKLISNGVMMNKPTYIPQLKTALFPVSMWDLGEDHTKDEDYIEDGAFVHGLSIKGNKAKFGELGHYGKFPTLPNSLRTFDEHQVVQTDDIGGLMGLLRTRKGVYFTKSADYGKTWSVPEPFTEAGPTTSSRFYIGKLHSGNLVLIMNASASRTDMTAFISRDGGNTWPHRLLLDDRELVSYPDLDQTPDGAIHVVFDRERWKEKDILYCRFTEKDVFDGNEAGIYKTRVNKK